MLVMTIRLTDIALPLDHDEPALTAAIAKALSIAQADIVQITVFRRGFDARKKTNIHFIYSVDVTVANEASVLQDVAEATRQLPATAKRTVSSTPNTEYKFVCQAPAGDFIRPVVIGTGPCGLFAALALAQMGFKPVILERGKIVRERTKDTWGFWRKRLLKIESNVQFGEGGAGTFSDGKLWSQVKDPLFHGRKVLQDMVRGGAPEEIMYVSKPHVGTFRLVKVVEFLREEIIRLGGEFRFSHQVVDLHFEANNSHKKLAAVTVQGPDKLETFSAEHVVLAIGHSARDTFQMLFDKGVYVEAKPFSVGFRIEHPQSLIDRARFGTFAGHKQLGAADYKLVHHAKNGRSVYSFCMCPGGTVVAATSEQGRVVTNGMSQYSRNERNANAGIVVGINPQDFDFDATGKPLVASEKMGHPLAGMAFQRSLETNAFLLGRSTYDAPGQLLGDFLKGRASTTLGSIEPSYKPGVHLTNLGNPKNPSLPMYAITAIQEAIPAFAKQIPGFDLPDAVLTGVETRTSAPIRIKREDHGARSYQSVNVDGLYPAGEGAGYAGGIMSAAIDGIKVAEAVALNICATYKKF
jgi:uncharacterized protein